MQYSISIHVDVLQSMDALEKYILILLSIGIKYQIPISLVATTECHELT